MAASVQGPWVDSGVSEPALDLYRYERAASGVEAFEDVGPAEVTRFQEDGYLVVRRAFGPDTVRQALAGILDLVAGRVPGFRGIQFEARGKGAADGLLPEEQQDHVRKLWLFCPHEPRLRALAEDPALLAVVARLMATGRASREAPGGDAPPLLFQDQAMLKPPLGGREKPWHQDNAYFNVPPDTPVVGVWIALDPATPENGCMHVIPGSQREGPVVHFSRRDWQICDAQVATARDVMVPLCPGGCLFFHGLLHHGTPANNSPQRRRALQFHYRPAGTPATTSEQRLAVFGSEGKDVTC